MTGSPFLIFCMTGFQMGTSPSVSKRDPKSQLAGSKSEGTCACANEAPMASIMQTPAEVIILFMAFGLQFVASTMSADQFIYESGRKRIVRIGPDTEVGDLIGDLGPSV